MDFIDDVDFIFSLVGAEIDLLAQVPHIFHGGIGGCVNLDQVQEAAFTDRFAICALITGTGGRVRVLAVDRLRQ